MQAEGRTIKLAWNSSSEAQRILCKDNTNREQKRQTSLGDYAEMQFVLCKDNTNRVQKKENKFILFC